MRKVGGGWGYEVIYPFPRGSRQGYINPRAPRSVRPRPFLARGVGGTPPPTDTLEQAMRRKKEEGLALLVRWLIYFEFVLFKHAKERRESLD